MMGEPLFDGVSAAIVFFGSVAVIVLRSAVVDAENVERTRRLNLVGNVLLGIAISLLLYRWVDAVTALPGFSRSNEWRSGALTIACGIGLVAAMKAVIGPSVVSRVRHFGIAAVYSTIALLIPWTWEWTFQKLSRLASLFAFSHITAQSMEMLSLTILILTMLVPGIALAMWFPIRAMAPAPITADEDKHREPALVLFTSAALLLLLLGTWQHVIANEAQRKTRSARYSAWPRATALRNAWERTGWTAKLDDDNSAKHVADVAAREQRIALGLGSLLLVVAAAAGCRTSREPTIAEADHAG
ncbi:hypothetical protein LBMAG52_15770 [Planctomycetia bacterium]|nr:hypothetical protein LBMAG52_15770 [Planctomycetia bacterium]